MFCSSFPYHECSEKLLLQYFYEGLMSMERKMVDATSRGALVKKDSHMTRNLIATKASNF